MAWQQLTMPLRALDQPRTEQALIDAGAVAITYTDAADQPILEPAPGEAPLWRDAIVTALFPEHTSIERIGLTLISELTLEHLPAFSVELLADREWEREWLESFKPMRFGERLWVCPHHADVDADGAVVIRLDPGLAFGTGTHATTALCLARLDSMPLEGLRVLDFGCGSGILAIAALLLGADAALGIDIDPQALTATASNATDNAVAGRLETAGADAAQTLDAASFDVVLANILARPLIELAPTLCESLRPGGRLLLSGILETQADEVLAAYSRFVEFAEVTRQDGWTLLDGVRKCGP